MRALLVGAGGMGRAWAGNLHANPEVDLAGWIDVRDGAALDAAATLGLQPGYCGTDFQEALTSLQPDFVVDVTPPEVHREITIASLRHGVPVIGEKPMAVSMSDAREMVAASEQSGKLYMVSQSRRYNNQARAFRNLINDSLQGLGILNVDFYIGAHFGGFRDQMGHVLLIDMAIHTFDAARMISGRDPVSVYAEEFNPQWSWYEGAASANVMFEMEDGLRFNYRGSWCAEGLHTSWEGDWRAIGPTGTAVWIGDRAPSAAVVTETSGFHSKTEAVSSTIGDEPEGIAGSLADFIKALKTGSTPEGECRDNIKSLGMVFAAIESSIRSERVEIAEILG